MKKVVAYSILTFWAVMVAWFIRREVIPGLYARPVRGYAALRRYTRTRAGSQTSSRMGVYTGNTRVGVLRTTYQIKPNGDFEATSMARIHFERHAIRRLNFGGPDLAPKMRVDLSSEVVVGRDNALKTFRVAWTIGASAAFAAGVVRDNRLEITITSPAGTLTRSVRVTPGDIVSSGLMTVGAMPHLKVGQSWQIKALNPFEGRFHTVTVHVRRKTRILLRGHWYDVYEVETGYGPAVVKSYVNDRGDVLKEEALGVTFIREPLPHERPASPAATSPPAGG